MANYKIAVIWKRAFYEGYEYNDDVVSYIKPVKRKPDCKSVLGKTSYFFKWFSKTENDWLTLSIPLYLRLSETEVRE